MPEDTTLHWLILITGRNGSGKSAITDWLLLQGHLPVVNPVVRDSRRIYDKFNNMLACSNSGDDNPLIDPFIVAVLQSGRSVIIEGDCCEFNIESDIGIPFLRRRLPHLKVALIEIDATSSVIAARSNAACGESTEKILSSSLRDDLDLVFHLDNNGTRPVITHPPKMSWTFFKAAFHETHEFDCPPINRFSSRTVKLIQSSDLHTYDSPSTGKQDKSWPPSPTWGSLPTSIASSISSSHDILSSQFPRCSRSQSPNLSKQSTRISSQCLQSQLKRLKHCSSPTIATDASSFGDVSSENSISSALTTNNSTTTSCRSSRILCCGVLPHRRRRELLSPIELDSSRLLPPSPNEVTAARAVLQASRDISFTVIDPTQCEGEYVIGGLDNDLDENGVYEIGSRSQHETTNSDNCFHAVGDRFDGILLYEVRSRFCGADITVGGHRVDNDQDTLSACRPVKSSDTMTGSRRYQDFDDNEAIGSNELAGFVSSTDTKLAEEAKDNVCREANAVSCFHTKVVLPPPPPILPSCQSPTCRSSQLPIAKSRPIGSPLSPKPLSFRSQKPAAISTQPPVDGFSQGTEDVEATVPAKMSPAPSWAPSPMSRLYLRSPRDLAGSHPQPSSPSTGLPHLWASISPAAAVCPKSTMKSAWKGRERTVFDREQSLREAHALFLGTWTQYSEPIPAGEISNGLVDSETHSTDGTGNTAELNLSVAVQGDDYVCHPSTARLDFPATLATAVAVAATGEGGGEEEEEEEEEDLELRELLMTDSLESADPVLQSPREVSPVLTSSSDASAPHLPPPHSHSYMLPNTFLHPRSGNQHKRCVSCSLDGIYSLPSCASAFCVAEQPLSTRSTVSSLSGSRSLSLSLSGCSVRSFSRSVPPGPYPLGSAGIQRQVVDSRVLVMSSWPTTSSGR